VHPVSRRSSHSSATDFAATLIRWHRRHGRHDLPWQRPRTPYRVWISEVMLQQTQVATVVGYYQRFLQRFPDVATLAASGLDEVLHLWSGLGYYSRARSLHAAAQRVVNAHGGELPVTRAQLMELPGIGRSTAGAILALAHDRPEAILDANVRRVLARRFGIGGTPGARETEQQLWRQAEQCTPASRAATYTQAIMDFGATLCTQRAPACPRCPLAGVCVAQHTGRVAELPPPRTRAPRRTRTVVMLLALRRDGRMLLQRRPPRGVWGGLWTPPEFHDAASAARYCGARLAAAQLEPEPLPPLRHAFTHFDLEITPLRARCEELAGVMEGAATLWYNPREPARIGVPAPIAALLSSLMSPAPP
jgi:A/G-specific adenine glycosylase